jgi:hypothetical protein
MRRSVLSAALRGATPTDDDTTAEHSPSAPGESHRYSSTADAGI